MTRYVFKCEGEELEVVDQTSGPATARANKELNVDNRPAGVWQETAPNEFTWTPHQA